VPYEAVFGMARTGRHITVLRKDRHTGTETANIPSISLCHILYSKASLKLASDLFPKEGAFDQLRECVLRYNLLRV
jgi:hypothetical protein